MSLFNKWDYYFDDLRKHKTKEIYQERYCIVRGVLDWINIPKQQFYIRYAKKLKDEKFRNNLKIENEIKQCRDYIKAIKYLLKEGVIKDGQY